MKASRLVFAGGGHAHLYSLARTADFISSGHDVTLVSASPHLYYSSMATGVLSGRFSSNENRLDVRNLVESGGGRFVEGTIEHVLPEERALLLTDGRVVPYDLVSFCLGSGMKFGGADAVPVKPVENLTRLRDTASENGASSLLVVGGGVAGCEVAANAASLAPRGKTTLVEAAPDILSFAPKQARSIMRERLRSAGVEVMIGAEVASFEPGAVVLGDGRRIAADIVVAATGISPPDIFARSNLATAEDGGLWVDHYLRSVSDGRIFGGGDSISFRGEPLPRLGVYAIRQGSVLFRNLHATLEGNPLTEFRPQKTYLYILNLGDGTGLGIYGPLVWRGRSALRLKDFIDGKFIDSYQRPAVSDRQNTPR